MSTGAGVEDEVVPVVVGPEAGPTVAVVPIVEEEEEEEEEEDDEEDVVVALDVVVEEPVPPEAALGCERTPSMRPQMAMPMTTEKTTTMAKMTPTLERPRRGGRGG
jgi:hypothetical protein